MLLLLFALSDNMLMHLIQLPLKSIILIQRQVPQVKRNAQITPDTGIIHNPLILVACNPKLDGTILIHGRRKRMVYYLRDSRRERAGMVLFKGKVIDQGDGYTPRKDIYLSRFFHFSHQFFIHLHTSSFRYFDTLLSYWENLPM